MSRTGKLEYLTRLGFAARGLVYMMIGYLAFRLGRAEDVSGALEYLSGGVGRALLAAMALGFAAYSFWRLSEAAIDTQGRGNGLKGIGIRLAGAGSGIIYLGLAFYAARLAAGAGGHGGGSSRAAEAGAATALQLPGGQTLLMAGALALVAVAAAQFLKAGKGRFLRHLESKAARHPWVLWTGRLGYAARGAVFLVAALLLWRAGSHASPSEAGGLKDALSWLGGTARAAVAIGLFGFGLFSLVEARYRRITDPRVLERLGDAARAVTA